MSKRGGADERPVANKPFTQGEISAYRTALFEALQDTRFIVFLCGPSLRDRKNAGARVRREIKKRLEKHGVEVVLGEDDGLEDVRLAFGVNAQDNELEFIKRSCDTVIIVAGSVGSFCELGLFTWHYAHREGVLTRAGRKDLIVLIERKYEKRSGRRKSYLLEGPAKAAHGFGLVEYIDFQSVDVEKVVARVLERRATFIQDRRDRPRKTRAAAT